MLQESCSKALRREHETVSDINWHWNGRITRITCMWWISETTFCICHEKKTSITSKSVDITTGYFSKRRGSLHSCSGVLQQLYIECFTYSRTLIQNFCIVLENIQRPKYFLLSYSAFLLTHIFKLDFLLFQSPVTPTHKIHPSFQQVLLCILPSNQSPAPGMWTVRIFTNHKYWKEWT